MIRYLLLVVILFLLLVACSDSQPPDGTPPAAVIDLTVNSVGDSSATLTWTAPGDLIPSLEESFIDTIQIDDSQLWVRGHRVEGPVVVAVFDGSTLLLDDRRVDFKSVETSISEDVLIETFGNVPMVKSATKSGVAIGTAVDNYFSVRSELITSAREAYRLGGQGEAILLLERSPFVESVETVEGSQGIRVLFKGIPGRVAVNLKNYVGASPRKPNNSERARRLVDELKTNRRTLQSELIVVTKSGTNVFCSGEIASRIKAQINHIVLGGDTQSIPAGPWRPDRMPLLEFVRAREGGGQ